MEVFATVQISHKLVKQMLCNKNVRQGRPLTQIKENPEKDMPLSKLITICLIQFTNEKIC